jgi:L-lactate dehydrogenase complex protein LldG
MNHNGNDTARANILARIRATTDHIPEPPPLARTYHAAHVVDGLTELLAHNLTDYRAHVHHASTTHDVRAHVTRLITGPRLVIPDGIPDAWIPEGVEPLHDTPPLTNAQLDTAHAVITTAALAIAETGTLVLDAGPGQGRRALTLIPDHHICIITPARIYPSLPTALPQLNPHRPQTWISGPSATSDIELDRVEGVHGPRTLDIIILNQDADEVPGD